ncbi:ketopantoate hydroxymethyltransferase [Georgenia satyanarayanai]|uniref:3-methyl-2-oxobutanoate hydroxymethyltransferase n=1 Tax=Georgenia satyanarayanai TaxID=860221 RepID=A0A2Y9A2Z9_9MICO|nr:3-methyl-2-oxobutanoate hydroxymethyltransferase [Georgenia satyanarayanai]PYG01737.1 ketopantoate hydroxymethyltransferase [Georgenia satyanarayanai]SSA36537.1 ketopantoate hydroxymethyltransferase [Georgenia satyanarayanai]
MSEQTPASTPAASGAPGGVPVPKRVRVHHLAQMKERGEPITMLTAYDAVTGRIFDEAGIDMLLVGDSIGNTMLGLHGTIPVTLDEMIPAARAVTGAAHRAMVVADLPFGSYEASPQHAFASAVRMLKEGGVHAVKLEGGERIAEHVRLLSQSGIPVVGHLGFTPQSENSLGGARVQGRGDEAAERLVQDAVALQEAGAVAVVLEMVPAPVAERATEVLHIPTIGIGAGPGCDGQVLVWTDMAGMTAWAPRFARKFGDVGAALYTATRTYAGAVRERTFPGPEHTFAE